MIKNQIDLDARRIETRANQLIEKCGLADDYGETGGLIATYEADKSVIIVEDEALKAEFPVEEDGRVTQKTWNNIRCHVTSFTDCGCAEEHEHYQAE